MDKPVELHDEIRSKNPAMAKNVRPGILKTGLKMLFLGNFMVVFYYLGFD